MTITGSAQPDEQGLIRGLAQAPLHLQNLVAELVDNALAAHGGSPMHAWVDLSRHVAGGDDYVLRVWDDGPGIAANRLANQVLAIGKPPIGQSHLNEHGFGLKNVLAKVQQLSTAPWTIYSRDADSLQRGNICVVRHPLTFTPTVHELAASDWPAFAPVSTGTAIELPLPLSYLQSIAFGRRGALPRDPNRIMDYLREHLGVLYRGYVMGGHRAKALIRTSLTLGSQTPVDPVEPEFAQKTRHDFHFSYGGRRISVEGETGLVLRHCPQTRARLLYYRHAPESQGVDMRIGDRVIATRLLSEIWDRERHPSFNGLAGEFRIVDPSVFRLPTLNNKTSIDFDSMAWHALAEAIQHEVPAEDLPHGGGKSEADLQDELFRHISGLKDQRDLVEKGFDCGGGVYVDIIWDKTAYRQEIEIFEAKKGRASPINLYQLVMYWDALVDCRKQPTRAHLVSAGHTAGVTAFLRLLRSRKDKNGKKYNLQLDDWATHGIDPEG